LRRLQFLRFFKHITDLLPTLWCHGSGSHAPVVWAIW
jgi:hypothetical protein